VERLMGFRPQLRNPGRPYRGEKDRVTSRAGSFHERR
jgi:hypothetical protein